MSVKHLFVQTLTIQTQGTVKDGYGNTVPGAVTSTQVLGYAQPNSSTEELVDRDTAQTQWLVMLPAGTVIAQTDSILYAGHTLQVQGSVQSHFNPRSMKVSHLECQCVEVV